MKKLLLSILVLSVAAGAFAQAKKGQFGLQTSVVFTTTGPIAPGATLGAEYMIADNMGIRAGLGFLNSGGTTDFSFAGGFEYHFSGKGGVSPYVGAEASYSGESVTGGGATPSEFGVNAVFGAQYFFSPNFAWGGEVQLGYTSRTAGGATTTSLGTNAVQMNLTWFLN